MIVITDWKTNRVRFPSLIHNRQAQLYAVAVNRLFSSKVPIKVEFQFVRYPEAPAVSWSPTLEEINECERELCLIHERISLEPTKAPGPKPTVGLHCRYCAFNYTCNPYKLWISEVPGSSQIWEAMELSELIKEFDYIKNQYYATKRHHDQLKDIILTMFEREGIDGYENYCLGTRYKTQWSEHALEVIQSWGGLDNMPLTLKNELTQQHQIRIPGNPFLREVR